MKKNYIFGLLATMLLLAFQISAKTNVTNYVLNPGFELDNAVVQKPLNWGQWLESGTVANLTLVNGDAHSGSYYCKMQGAAAYKVMTMQTITGLPAGTYTLTGWFRSSGGQGWGNMSVKNYGGSEVYAGINSAMSTWTKKTISNINITTGTCEIDIYQQSGAGQWTDYDDIELTLVVPLTGVALSPTIASININESKALTATLTPANASNNLITWTSSNDAVAKVSATGVVTGVSVGTATITATTQDGGKTATSIVTVLTPIIVNGGFESGKTGWQKSWGKWTIVTDKHSGDSAAMIPLASWGNGLTQRFNVDPQSVYEFKFWAKTGSKGTDLPVYLSIKNSKGQNIGNDPNYTVKVSAKNWTQYSIKFQTIELMDSVDLWIGDGKTDTLYIDDIEVNKSNFVNNGGFEDGKVGWGKSSGSFDIVNDVHSGSSAALLALSNWKNVLVQRFDAEELTPYEFKFWAKVAATSKKVNINLGLKNTAGKNVGPDPNFSISVDSKIWKEYSCKFNTLAAVDSIDLWIGDGTTDSLYIDDIQLIPSSIITNGSFESGKTGWEKSSGSFDLVSPGQSGDFAARLALSNWKNVIVQRINVEQITSYELKLWAKVSGKNPVNINLSEKNSAGKGVGSDPNEKISVSTNAWKSYSLKFSTLSAVDSLDLWVGDGVTDTLYIDNITILPLAFTSVTGIALDSTSLSLKINGIYKLKATITPLLATNKEVIWTSSDPLIATVDVNGTVTAVKVGNATITATTADCKLTSICAVKVVTLSGIVNQEFAKIRIYPNPVVGILAIENEETIERVEICNLSGQVMMTSAQYGNKAYVDLSMLSTGFYILKVYQQNNSVKSFKITKK
jgi:uncharacterized protein YjdB